MVIIVDAYVCQAADLSVNHLRLQSRKSGRHWDTLAAGDA